MQPVSPVGLSGILMASLALAIPLSAQTASVADPDDVSSIDAIMTAVYDVISGPAEEPRDWDRFRSLFWPGAQLIPTFRNQGGDVVANRMSVEEFVTSASGGFAINPFFEIEAGRVAERYGNIAHIFSTYESRRDPEQAPFVRGINSFQLMFDDSRWWVVNIFWTDERLAGPIPPQYLQN